MFIYDLLLKKLVRSYLEAWYKRTDDRVIKGAITKLLQKM